jgi:hypothetical protein
VKRLAPLCLLLLPLAAAAQTVPHYTRVLVPLYFDKPVNGALGSVWTTQFSVYNSGSTAVPMGWCSVLNDSEACVTPGDSQIAAGATSTTLPTFTPAFNDAVPGRQLNFETVSDDQLSFGLRVADTSRSGFTAGTQIPVVRERDYFQGTVRMPNVPIDSRFRLTLRVYEMGLTSSAVTIRVFDQQTNALLGSHQFQLTAPTTGAFRFEPGYLQLGDLSSIVPSTTTLPSTVRIELEPSSKEARFWAFISITNNETQQLTVITPQ